MVFHAMLAKVTHIPGDHNQPGARWPSARRRKVIGPCLRGEEQLLQVRPGQPLQLPPLLDWKKHSSFDPRLVTICGPSARVVSNNSLNLDFAS